MKLNELTRLGPALANRAAAIDVARESFVTRRDATRTEPETTEPWTRSRTSRARSASGSSRARRRTPPCAGAGRAPSPTCYRKPRPRSWSEVPTVPPKLRQREDSTRANRTATIGRTIPRDRTIPPSSRPATPSPPSKTSSRPTKRTLEPVRSTTRERPRPTSCRVTKPTRMKLRSAPEFDSTRTPRPSPTHSRRTSPSRARSFGLRPRRQPARSRRRHYACPNLERTRALRIDPTSLPRIDPAIRHVRSNERHEPTRHQPTRHPRPRPVPTCRPEHPKPRPRHPNSTGRAPTHSRSIGPSLPRTRDRPSIERPRRQHHASIRFRWTRPQRARRRHRIELSRIPEREPESRGRHRTQR